MPVKETCRPELDALERQVAASGEAMQHGREGALPHFLFQNFRHVGVAVARMDDQRQPGFAGRGNVLAEACGLGVARAGVVVVVEAGLADGDDFRVFRHFNQRLGVNLRLLRRVMRMGADGAEHVGKTLGNGQNLCELAHPSRDGDHAADAGCARAGHHRVELGGKIGKIQMAVAIDKHGPQAFAASGST